MPRRLVVVQLIHIIHKRLLLGFVSAIAAIRYPSIVTRLLLILLLVLTILSVLSLHGQQQITAVYVDYVLLVVAICLLVKRPPACKGHQP